MYAFVMHIGLIERHLTLIPKGLYFVDQSGSQLKGGPPWRTPMQETLSGQFSSINMISQVVEYIYESIRGH